MRPDHAAAPRLDLHRQHSLISIGPALTTLVLGRFLSTDPVEGRLLNT
jgi:hypothetical protein